MSLFKTYKWFPAPRASTGASTGYAGHERSENRDRIDKELIGNILGMAGLPDEDEIPPSYKVVLVDDGPQVKALKDASVNQREFTRSSKVLVFATPENTSRAVLNETLAAVGTTMVSAALAGIDCADVEDFDSATVDDLLGLKEQGLHSIALLPLY